MALTGVWHLVWQVPGDLLLPLRSAWACSLLGVSTSGIVGLHGSGKFLVIFVFFVPAAEGNSLPAAASYLLVRWMHQLAKLPQKRLVGVL
jgi:hypothetical protein